MFLTAVVFIVILSILIFVHEFGHFSVARLIGVQVEEFGFGLPPRLWGKKIKGTIYSINWLPIGGFVKLAGEDETPDSPKPLKSPSSLKSYFWARSKKERAAILLAGVTMNFLLAVGISTYLLTQGVPEISGRIHVERVLPGSPAAAAGLKEGDILADFKTPKDLIDFVNEEKGREVVLSISRGNETFDVPVTPRVEVPPGEGPLGVAISDLEIKTYPWSQAPFEAVKLNLLRARDMLFGIGTLVARLVQLRPVGEDVAGPIGIARVTGTAVKFGFNAVLEFMSILSLNLAVLNVLPIPALDGGRLAFVFLEKILGRKVRPAFEQSTHQIGMVILFVLILLISINDILRIARGG